MKSFKYLLVLPFAMVALASCGGASDNFGKEIELAAAKEITDNYAQSIQNSKASSITIAGRVNNIDIKGDATWWSYITPGEGGMSSKMGFLSMIPNFSVKDSQIKVDAHDIASFSIPGSLASLGSFASTFAEDEDLLMGLTIVGNLPKFPMNYNLLRAINGLKSLPEETTVEAWSACEDEAWKNAKVTFASSNSGRLKITLATDDCEAFFEELANRYFKNKSNLVKKSYSAGKTYPGSFTITTSKIGYVDSFSANFKAEGIKLEEDKIEQLGLYLYLNGDVEINFGLTFKQTISNPVTIKYQLSAYHETTATEKPDIEYNGQQLTYDAAKSKDITTNLSDFSAYLTFERFSNTQLDDEDYPSLQKNTRFFKPQFDDPVFCYNYWNGNEKNIAFTNEVYDIFAIPTYKTDKEGEITPNCSILGGTFHEYGKKGKITSFVTTSKDGRVISDNTGLAEEGYKLLNSAGDALQDVHFATEKGTIDVNKKIQADEIFINSNMLEATDSTYIVNIAILVPME